MTTYTIKKQAMGLVASAVLTTSVLFAPVTKADTYTVKSGDTLSQIALAYHTDLEALAKLNGLKNVDLIFAGQVLELTPNITLSKSEPAKEPAAQTNVTSSPAATYQSNLSVSDAEAKEIIAFKESSGSYTAQNGQYYGRYQLTLSYLNGDLSPENQERVADEYVRNRYGSWSAALVFWQANGWY